MGGSSDLVLLASLNDGVDLNITIAGDLLAVVGLVSVHDAGDGGLPRGAGGKGVLLGSNVVTILNNFCLLIFL